MKRYLSVAALSLMISAVIPVFAARANSITVEPNARMRAVTDHSTQSPSDALLQRAAQSSTTQPSPSVISRQASQQKDTPEYCAPFLSSHEDGALRDAMLYKCKYGS